MQFIIETISGRKGIKNFNSMDEYVNFMTKNADKIKTIVESEMPYDDKPVKLPKVSTSKGWDTVDSSTFGDIDSDGEKGDCLLPQGNQGVFKNNAQFEPSKSSEKADKVEEPKIEQSPVKTSENGSEKDFKEFKYEDSDKSESKPSEKSSDNKEDKKENKENKEDSDKKEEKQINESSIELKNVGRYSLRWSKGDVYEITDSKLGKVIYSSKNINNAKAKLRRLKKSESQEQVNEGFKDNLKKASKFAKGAIAGAAMAGALAGNAYGMEDPYYDGAQRPFNDQSYEQSITINGEEYTPIELKRLQKEYNLSDEEMQQIMNGEDPYYDGAQRPMGESLNSEIKETLRLAGVQLNETDDDYMEEQAHNEQDGEIDEKSGKTKLFEEEPKEKSYEDMEPSEQLEYAKKQVRAYEEEKMMTEYDDFAYTNGHMKRVEANLNGWEREVKRLEKLLNNESIDESCETLEETKPARYNQHLGKDKSFANISASRSNDEFEKPGMEKEKQKQSESNNKKTAQLKKDIKDLGLSYIKTYGAWRDEGPVTQEDSFLIPNITKEQALELGKKYGQYSVIFKEEGDDNAYMYITLDNEDFGKKDMVFDMGDKAKFTQVKKGKDELDPYSGYTGLKPGGKGYNLSYKVKEED